MGLAEGTKVLQETVADVAVGRAMNLQREVIYLEAAVQDALKDNEVLQQVINEKNQDIERMNELLPVDETAADEVASE